MNCTGSECCLMQNQARITSTSKTMLHPLRQFLWEEHHWRHWLQPSEALTLTNDTESAQSQRFPVPGSLFILPTISCTHRACNKSPAYSYCKDEEPQNSQQNHSALSSKLNTKGNFQSVGWCFAFRFRLMLCWTGVPRCLQHCQGTCSDFELQTCSPMTVNSKLGVCCNLWMA